MCPVEVTMVDSISGGGTKLLIFVSETSYRFRKWRCKRLLRVSKVKSMEIGWPEQVISPDVEMILHAMFTEQILIPIYIFSTL